MINRIEKTCRVSLLELPILKGVQESIPRKKSIPPTYLAWRAGTIALYLSHSTGPPGYIGWLGIDSWAP
jgi:hypothetical protein